MLTHIIRHVTFIVFTILTYFLTKSVLNVNYNTQNPSHKCILLEGRRCVVIGGAQTGQTCKDMKALCYTKHINIM